MSLKVELENVGGLMHTRNFSLERGVNRIRAPNAEGKTSFTKALELLVLSGEELRGKGYYGNLFVGSEEAVGVRLSGDINHERRFGRIGQENLKEIGTSSLVGSNGDRIINVCFAVPGNRLIGDFLARRGVKNYIDLLAGAENYEKAQTALQEIDHIVTTKIQHYRDLLIRLEEYEKQKKEDEKELEKLRGKFAKKPLLDEKEIFEDFGRYNKRKQELDHLNEDIASIRGKLQELEEAIESAKDNIKRYESQIQVIKTQHPRIDARLNEIANEIPIKRSDFSKSEEAYKKFKERQEMKVAIDQKEANIKRAEERIEEFKKQTLGVEDLEGKYDFIQFVKNHLEIRKNQIVEEIRGTFNRQVIELYKRLGFRDFDNIEIGPDFRISVTRKKGGKIIENFPLEALSTSERITIAIAFLLSAKNEYVQDFPFFVLDELITSYDPKRFDIVKDHLKRSEDYVVITELATDISDVEVIHES